MEPASLLTTALNQSRPGHLPAEPSSTPQLAPLDGPHPTFLVAQRCCGILRHEFECSSFDDMQDKAAHCKASPNRNSLSGLAGYAESSEHFGLSGSGWLYSGSCKLMRNLLTPVKSSDFQTVEINCCRVMYHSRAMLPTADLARATHIGREPVHLVDTVNNITSRLPFDVGFLLTSRTSRSSPRV